MSCIYGLYDASGALRYIGKANDPEKRLQGHMREARRRRTPLYDWINKHGRPRMVVLEEACADWREAERRHIAAARVRGENLLNLADGGDQPLCPENVRRANGHKLAELIRTDEEFRSVWHMKRQLSKALRDGFVRNRTRAIMRDAALRWPDKFGLFRNVRDREEDDNEEPIGGYGKLKGGGYGAPKQAYS